MKVIKVHIKRGGAGQNMMVYPTRYNAEEVDRNGIGPCDVNGTGAYSKNIGKGASEEWCYIILDDVLADEYVTDVDMEIVTAITADTDMEAWRIANHESEIIIRDPERVKEVKEKKAKSETLTAEEEVVLDPDNLMPGLNKRLRKVADRVADAGKTITVEPV